jgi:hypothetical protein
MPDVKAVGKGFKTVLRGWLIRVGLMAQPRGDNDEEPGTGQQERNARTWLQFHRHNLPRYRR